MCLLSFSSAINPHSLSIIHPARVSFGWWSCLCFLKASRYLFAMLYRGLQSIQIFPAVEVPWRMSCVDPLFIVLICTICMFELYPNL